MSEPEHKPAFVFGGFDSPNTTQVPDAFFDVVAPQLSEAELRVALYIIRRTFGFKKDTDNISLRQMVEGITTKDGRVLDRGTGLRKSAVANALNGLERKGIILSQRNRSRERGNEPTTYALNIKNHPLSVPVDKGLSIHADKPLSVPVDTQYTVEQQTVRQQTDINSTYIERQVFDIRPVSFSSRKDFDNFDEDFGNGENRAPIEPVKVSDLLSRNYPKLSAESRKTGPNTAATPEDDSQPGEVLKRGRGRPRKYPPISEAPAWLKLRARDLSNQLNDPNHEEQNLGQLWHLFLDSGAEERRFNSKVDEAKSLTLKAVIEKKAAGEAGQWGLRNRAPYFFSTLRDRLGLPGKRRKPNNESERATAVSN